MKSEAFYYESVENYNHKANLHDANLVIYFADKGILQSFNLFEELKKSYPNAIICGCSTGGEIFHEEVYENGLSFAAIKMERTNISYAECDISCAENSFESGVSIAKSLNRSDLSYVLILADGINVNGSDLIEGLYNVIHKDVVITGGLAGDGDRFESTLVGVNAPPEEKRVIAIGFYGDAVKVDYGSVGGWNVFGPQRMVTKSDGNILYELDNKPALDLYKEYLGDRVQNLPGDALLFPLSIKPQDDEENDFVRTIVGIDEKKNALIFAGDIVEGSLAQLMYGDFNNLVEGASKAAEKANIPPKNNDGLTLMVSCIGRKLLMGQQISEETEAVIDILGDQTKAIGFYSYGEICHHQFTNKCSLHNQTMTITILNENVES